MILALANLCYLVNRRVMIFLIRKNISSAIAGGDLPGIAPIRLHGARGAKDVSLSNKGSDIACCPKLPYYTTSCLAIVSALL
jgi:hypothetical protein